VRHAPQGVEDRVAGAERVAAIDAGKLPASPRASDGTQARVSPSPQVPRPVQGDPDAGEHAQDGQQLHRPRIPQGLDKRSAQRGARVGQRAKRLLAHGRADAAGEDALKHRDRLVRLAVLDEQSGAFDGGTAGEIDPRWGVASDLVMQCHGVGQDVRELALVQLGECLGGALMVARGEGRTGLFQLQRVAAVCRDPHPGRARTGTGVLVRRA
jgi:hypothetical protein